MTDKYATLVRHILWHHDMKARIGPLGERLQGELDGLRAVLTWLEGYEGADLEGLREKFKED